MHSESVLTDGSILFAHLEPCFQLDPALLFLPTEMVLVGLLQNTDVLMVKRLPAVLWLHFPHNTRTKGK